MSARCLYALKKYGQCEKICANVAHLPEAHLLRGKSLYHMYQRKQRQLRKHQSTLEPKVFFTQHKACYNMAMEVIKIFRHARNNSYNGMDAECNRFLDFAISDYILEANKLKDLNICFLCLKRPNAATADSEVKTPTESQVQDELKDEPAKGEANQASKLKRIPKDNIRFSHLIPRSVISYFMKSADAESVLFGVSGTRENPKERTAGKAAVYMLCPSCEHNLSVLGEQAFKTFLQKVYDPLCSSTEIKYNYGKEMYHFCIGLIFRTLCPSQDEYINTDDVYQLLTQCRDFLTTDCPLQTCSDIPEVLYVLVKTAIMTSTFMLSLTKTWHHTLHLYHSIAMWKGSIHLCQSLQTFSW